jgi:ribonucleotide reductase beta subunit family protein with ferritin-like domain
MASVTTSGPADSGSAPGSAPSAGCCDGSRFTDAHRALFSQGDGRFVLFPIQLPDVWAWYKQQAACYWTVAEVDLAADVVHWTQRLTDRERQFVKVVLAFFAASDGIVGENLAVNMAMAFEAPEVRAFYAFQMMMENVHSEMYSLLIDALISDREERARLFAATQHYECVAAKAQWAQRWMAPGATLGQRLVAFAAVEGIFFSCSFCAIFWLRTKQVMPGLCLSNEFIARDEGLHTQFACNMVRMLPECSCGAASGAAGGNPCASGLACRCRPSAAVTTAIVRDAVETERLYVREVLRDALVGINAGLMEQYLECVADHLLDSLGVAPIYGTANPFDWMHMLAIEGKTNFHEKRVSEYQRAPQVGTWEVAEDF